MMGGCNRSHHVDLQPPEDGVVGELDVEDTELCDDVEMVRANWELDRAGERATLPSKS